jgi:GNAT superfamily N-acetyltransferase
MNIEIRETGIQDLPLEGYSRIPVSFEVRSILRVEVIKKGLGGFRLREEAIPIPYIKNYDAHPDGPPEAWGRQFDLANWGFLMAWDGAQYVGAAAVAHKTPVVSMLEARPDLAVLWDIRVHPHHRRQGVGGRLLQSAAAWAQQRGCRMMKIETQNVNVPACRFYAHLGCELGAIHRYGYAGVPAVEHEAMLVWYFNLG